MPLTGVRFVFALMVVLFHLCISTDWLSAVPQMYQGLMMQSGILGVSFFFILSGFILTLSYFGTQSAERQFRLRDFYIARIARIYPVYILGFLITVPLVMLGDYPALMKPESTEDKLLSVLSHVLLIQAWIPAFATSWNIPSWSLSAEAFFYLLFPFLTCWVLKLRTARGLFLVMLIAYTASLAITYIGSQMEFVSLYNSVMTLDNEQIIFVLFFPLFRLPEFIIGITAGALFMRHHEILSRYASLLVWVGLTGVLTGMIAGGWLIPLPYILKAGLAPFMASFLVGIAYSREGLGRLCGTKPMILLGQASYALYILHLPLILLFVQWPLDIPDKFMAGLYLSISISVSILAYIFCERPCQIRIRKLLRIQQ